MIQTDYTLQGREVLLWCEDINDTGSGECRSAGKRSKEVDFGISKHAQQEAEVETTYRELKE